MKRDSIPLVRIVMFGYVKKLKKLELGSHLETLRRFSKNLKNCFLSTNLYKLFSF